MTGVYLTADLLGHQIKAGWRPKRPVALVQVMAGVAQVADVGTLNLGRMVVRVPPFRV